MLLKDLQQAFNILSTVYIAADCLAQPALQVVADNDVSDFFQSALDRGNLCHDVHRHPLVGRHVSNTPDLTFDP